MAGSYLQAAQASQLVPASHFRCSQHVLQAQPATPGQLACCRKKPSACSNASKPTRPSHLWEELLQGALQAQADARQRRRWAAHKCGAAHGAGPLALAHGPALEAQLAAVVAAGAHHRVLPGVGEAVGQGGQKCRQRMQSWCQQQL